MQKNSKLAIGAIVTVVVIVGAYFIFQSPILNKPAKSSISILNIYDDKALMESEGTSGTTLYYFGVNFTYEGSQHSINLNASNFYAVTSYGDIPAFSPTNSPSNLQPLPSLQLTKGMSTQGEIAIQVSSGTSLKGIQFEDSSNNVLASNSTLPSMNYISYVHGITFASYNLDLHVLQESSGQFYTNSPVIGMSITFTVYNAGSVNITSITATSGFTLQSISPNVPIVIQNSQQLTVNFQIRPPSGESFYGPMPVTIDYTTQAL